MSTSFRNKCNESDFCAWLISRHKSNATVDSCSGIKRDCDSFFHGGSETRGNSDEKRRKGRGTSVNQRGTEGFAHLDGDETGAVLAVDE